MLLLQYLWETKCYNISSCQETESRYFVCSINSSLLLMYKDNEDASTCNADYAQTVLDSFYGFSACEGGCHYVNYNIYIVSVTEAE